MSIVISYLGSGSGRHPAMEKRRRPPPEDPHEEFIPQALRELLSVGAGSSEQQWAEVASLNLALQNAETSLALANHALQGVEAVTYLVTVLSDAVRGSLSDSGGRRLDARKRDIRELLRLLDEKARTTRFGKRTVLNGGLGVTGEAAGAGLAFVSAPAGIGSSPADGFPVLIERAPRQSRLVGRVGLGPTVLRQRQQFRIRAGPLLAHAETRGGESLEELVALLAAAIRKAGLELTVGITADSRLVLRHWRYGPGHPFGAESSVPGVLSKEDGCPEVARAGWDVVGTLNGEPAAGRGELLLGQSGNRTTAGLVVAYTGVPQEGSPAARAGPGSDLGSADQGAQEVGRVIVVQRSMRLRLAPLGPGTAGGAVDILSVPSLEPIWLGRRVLNASGFQNLAEIDVESVRQARDALKLAERAEEEVRQVCQSLQSVRDTWLLPHLRVLRVRASNLCAAGGFIGDLDLARGLAAHVSGHVWRNRDLARVAQPSLGSGQVMRLIN